MRSVIRMVTGAVLVILTACAGGGEPPASQPSLPASEPTPPATAAPSSGDTLTGTLGGDAQLEGGCAWVDDGRQRWEVQYPQGYTITFDPLVLTGPDGPVAEEGDTVTLAGAAQDDAITICQVGRVWAATSVEAAAR